MKLIRVSRKSTRKDWGCPRTKSRSTWCHAHCVPSADGLGDCGRLAGHALLGRTQLAILEHKERQGG
jgi:hypothetical protein